MSKTKIIVVGAGIAGPVLATFLKLNGYDPIVYERAPADDEAGISLMLQSNGLRVLSLIPGLVEKIPGNHIQHLNFYSTVPNHEEKLAESDIPSIMRAKYDMGMIGTQRGKFRSLLLETAQQHGVEIKWGHKLASLQQADDQVHVTFENGHVDTGSFVVGCDGLHSNTRVSLFGKEQADFTGLVQISGFSPTPSVLSKYSTMANFFGDGAHIVTYPITATHSSWAISIHEAEAKETWRAMDDKYTEEIKNGPFSAWGLGAGDLVKSTEKIIKYGLYDRPALPTWHQGRVVLLGDAAHPTSPHLGQGANQAFEDVHRLVQTLVKHNPDASPPSSPVLETVFTEYESLRLSQTAAAVAGARKQGELRVVKGFEACKLRNEGVKKMWEDPELVLQRYMSDGWVKASFDHEK